MNDLPEGWVQATLGEIGQYINGRGFKKSEWRDSGRPIIRIQNLTGTSAEYNYFQGDAEDRHIARSGDLLISWAATLGVFEWKGPEAVVNQHIFKVESFIDQDFHRLLVEFALGDLRRHAHGSGMVHVTKATFDSTRVAVPPLAEQRRIVDAIEEFFSRIDAGADVLQSAGNKAATAMRQFRRAALAGWPTCDLSDVAEVVSGNTPKGLENIPGGTIPFYKVGDMNESDGTIMGPSRTWIDETTRQNLGIHLRPEGTVIFPKRGGAIATNKKRQLGSLAAFDLNTMGVIPGEGISAEYLIEWFQTIDLSQLSDGSNVPQINHGDIRPLRIPVPPPQEQVRIVTEIRLVSDAVRYGSALAESALKRLETLRIGVLALALSGRLVPQDPQAKTAGALLDRIHAERADSLGRSPRKMAKK